MKRILLLLAVAAMLAATMVATSGAAFAVCSPGGPVAANDQAQGCFSTGSTQAVPNSGFNASEGLQTAYMHNTNP